MQDGLTIGAIFASAVASHGDRPFFAVPPGEGRSYLSEGFEISYRDADRQVAQLSAAYRSAGYGLGHRVATLLENRPEHVLHKLALNALGVCFVPINPDYRAGEIAYLLEPQPPDLVLTLARASVDRARPWPQSRASAAGRAWRRASRQVPRCPPAPGAERADHRPRPRPASSTPPAPPGGPRAAS